jgi:hypothetical protein
LYATKPRSAFVVFALRSFGLRYSRRKAQGAIPYDEIIAFCNAQNISLDLIFGNGANTQKSTIIGDAINVNIGSGDGNTITIGARDFADASEATEIVKNLRFAPKPYLDEILSKLRKFRAIAAPDR